MMFIVSSNLYSVTTSLENKQAPAKRNTIKPKLEIPKVTDIQGLPKKAVALGSKFKLTLKGNSLNKITNAQLLNGNHPAGKALLATANKATDKFRQLSIIVDKRPMSGQLMLKLYAGKTVVTLPQINPIQLVSNNQPGKSVKRIPIIIAANVVTKPEANKQFQFRVIAKDEKTLKHISLSYRGKTQLFKAKGKSKSQENFTVTLIAPATGRQRIEVVAVDDENLSSKPVIVIVDIQPPTTDLFRSITINTAALKFTGQRPDIFESISITTGALKFTGQRPEYFESITVNTGTLKFTGQRPDIFESISITTNALKFTGQRPEYFESITINTGRLKFTGQRPQQ